MVAAVLAGGALVPAAPAGAQDPPDRVDGPPRARGGAPADTVGTSANRGALARIDSLYAAGDAAGSLTLAEARLAEAPDEAAVLWR
ncbi:MAG: hypothetical protein D6701_10220, partial [Gemmatimonadetes bacterium]